MNSNASSNKSSSSQSVHSLLWFQFHLNCELYAQLKLFHQRQLRYDTFTDNASNSILLLDQAIIICSFDAVFRMALTSFFRGGTGRLGIFNFLISF